MADLIAYSVGVDNNALVIDGTDGAYSGYAKLFYIPIGYNKVTTISFRLKRQNDPVGAVAEIYATSGPSYLPTGEPIASEDVPALTTEYAWHSVTFNTTLSSETWYAAVIRSTAAWEPLHYVLWVGQTSPPDQENVGAEPEYYNLVWQSTGGDVSAQIKVYGEAIVPTKATNPTPIDTADDVILNQKTIIWEDGGGATSYDVYYGDDAAEVAAADNTDETGIYLGNQAGLSFTITDITLGSPFEYLAARYWRIDAVNDAGITTGDPWSFVTIAFDPPLPTGITLDVEGEPTGTPTGENNMITVRKLIAAAENKIWYENI